ncbi:hypothetical protein TorRG33x02_088940 [Trema orientale]|uniref:Uncharacterized protein n=1 Tax=Trema orientale TaxID=63057 RepID=A0A2P5FC68_TREOI|nr:hypothetical protein TorRG33x02_088940 [Trema orientale]
MESLGPEAEPSSKCRNVEMNLMSTPVALLTPQSDVLPASLSELKPAELDKDHMDSLGHEAGTSSAGRNVVLTPMTGSSSPVNARQSDMLPISHSVRGKPLSSAQGSYGFFGTGSRDFQYRPKC